jgi:hypothetical protein
MQLNGVASAVLVIWFILSSLTLIALLAVIAVALVKLQAKLDEVVERVDPLLGKADTLLVVAEDKLRIVGDRAESLLTTGEEIAVTVQDRVDKTTGTVQRTVNAPLIQANALRAGLSQAWQTFGSRAQTQNRVRKTLETATSDAETTQKQEVKIYGG